MQQRPEASSWKGKPSGFTLVEVLVTMTILGFIMLMIFGVLRLGLSAWAKGETLQGEYQKIRIASQLISRQIKSIVPYKIKASKAEGDYLAFEGRAGSLKFVSALPLKARQPEGFVFVIYDFKRNGKEKGALVLYEQKVLNKDFMEANPKEETEVTLIENLSDVRFEYYREEDPQKNLTAEWVGEWNAREEKELPKAIRVTFIQKEGMGPKEGISIPIMTSLPANRYEEIRTIPSRRIIPQRPPGV